MIEKFSFPLALLALASATPVRAQSLADGLDSPPGLGAVTTESFSYDGPALPSGLWTHHTAVSHDNVDSVKSSLPARSESRLRATVAGPAIVSFWWKVNAAVNGDTLSFLSANDVVSIGGNQDWQHRSFEVDSGPQEIGWLFERYSLSPAGDREAWIDQLTLAPIPNSPSLQAALDIGTSIPTIHSTSWTEQTVDNATNGTAARSGPVDAGKSSSMVFEVTGPAVVSFDWGITSDENGSSQLALLVEGDPVVTPLSGSQVLHRRTVDLGPGTHSLKFQFTRDLATNEEYTGPYEGYVDNLLVSAFGESATLAEAVERPSGVYSNSWTRQTQTHTDGVDSAMATAPHPLVARRLYVDLPEEPGLLTFWTKTETDAGKGILYVFLDDDLTVQRSGTGDWQKTEINLKQGADRILEAAFYRTENVDANSPFTKVYLDSVQFIPWANNLRPDLLIGPKGKPLVGEGVLNASGIQQTATILTTPQRPYGDYKIRVKNHSPSDPDTFLLRSAGVSRVFDVLFVVTVGKKKLNYTAALKTGRFSTLKLDPGAYETHEIWVSRRQRSTGRTHNLRVTGTSKTDISKIDVIRTRLTIKG